MKLGYEAKDGLCCEEQEEDQEDCSDNKHNITTTPACSPSSSASHRYAPGEAVEKEHMFDKVLTPSDVGKLNRLVIPKQQAEKHFPLDASASEKGLLLSFEDRHGKPWPFRYSYWNSSQSYVMTKGWSRFVKEKRLDAGGTVSFARGVGESARGRLFIDWKRRPEVHDPSRLQPRMASNYPMASFGRMLVPTAASAVAGAVPAAYRNAVGAAASGSGGSGQYLVYRSVVAPPQPVMPMVPAAKRVRLFGVNLDFQESETPHPYQRLQQELSSSSSSPSPQPNEQQQSLDLDLQ